MEFHDDTNRAEALDLRRTGFFQSRTVTVGGSECSVQQLITALGDKINHPEETNLQRLGELKKILKTVSEREKADRSFTSSLSIYSQVGTKM